jgi:guanylate kinase
MSKGAVSKGTLFIVSAASGTGKTSLLKHLLQELDALEISVSHTTRPPRPGEQPGVHYHFVSEDEFNAMLNTGAFLEYAQVFGYAYGTGEAWIEQELSQGNDVILEIDWQGAQQVRRLRPDAVSVFILPPSRETLEVRLRQRGQDQDDVITRRLSQAVTEISHYSEYDHIIVNDHFDTAISELKAIVVAQRLKIGKQVERHMQMLKRLLS